MSELNKRLSALSRQQGQHKGMAYSDIKPATIKPVKQANLKPWAALGVLSLGVVMGVGGWQWWQSDEPVSNVVKAVSPVATAEAASDPLAEETPVIIETVKPAAKVEPTPVPVQQPAKAPVPAPAQPTAKAQATQSAASKPSVSKPPMPKPVSSKPDTPKPDTSSKIASSKLEVAASQGSDDHEASAMEVADGEESLMIETVELDAGQLAQIEYKKAEKALKEGDSRKAIGYLESAVKYNPEWITARQKLAALYYGRGETRRAIASLQQGLTLDSAQPDLRLTMAKLLVNESQQQAALNVLSQMPAYTHSGYLAMRGALAQQLNQNDLALSSYQNLVKAEPYDGRWWLGLGVALERGQELEQAEEAYQQALQYGADFR